MIPPPSYDTTEIDMSPAKYPWQEPEVRTDVIKQFNLRLPEDVWLKLRYCAERRGQSMQAFCMDKLLPEIDRQVVALAGPRALSTASNRRKKSG